MVQYDWNRMGIAMALGWMHEWKGKEGREEYVNVYNEDRIIINE